MARNIKKEKAWAAAKYGPQLRAQLESAEQYEAFRTWLRAHNISYAAWLQQKVREQLEEAGPHEL
ncbi:MAG: hypothetical protein PHO66_05610 [Eubacteriales bacterium]|nr:hypothetical protein [Eubacteriales bacterium]